MLNKIGKRHIFMAAALLFALLLRAACFYYKSPDYIHFLQPWMEEFRSGGGFAALRTTTSNYNLPYLYFLALISYLPLSDLLLIKSLSVLFDILLAAALYRAAAARSSSASAAVVFAAALLWPTFILNSAYWGQCDSIYAAFCVMSYERAMAGRPKTSVIMAGAAFAFKLQTVFFLPVFLVLWAAGRVKPRHAVLFPLPYIITSLPAAAMGWTPGRIVGVYTGQAGIYSSYLTLNAPSIFAFLPKDTPKQPYFTAGIILAAAFCIAAAAHALRKRPDQTAVYAAMITLGVPWLLPSMHDRYFYLAEAFMLLYAAARPRYALLPVMVMAGSLGGYHAYLIRGALCYDLWPFALLMLLALLAVCVTALRRPDG
ncbi:MAG: conjugal transfer protein TraL [Oscillospiraceae bacterium]|nr:conjugal transfer protein TraL [Oscillospiraceae bacterium]